MHLSGRIAKLKAYKIIIGFPLLGLNAGLPPSVLQLQVDAAGCDWLEAAGGLTKTQGPHLRIPGQALPPGFNSAKLRPASQPLTASGRWNNLARRAAAWPASRGNSSVIRLLRGLSDIAGDYPLILCDVWGVLHNGIRAFDGAKDALARYRKAGGCVVLLTNSPNPGWFVTAQLGRLGVTRNAYDAIVSSGDVTVSLLIKRAGACLFQIGPPGETALFDEVRALTGKAPRVVPLKEAQYVLCTGLSDPFREVLADYDATLAAMRARDLELICANPDILVEDGGEVFYCAGAVAERYAAAGGKVIMAGKPFAPIYVRALELAREFCGGGNKSSHPVLVIGDTMATDIKGAHLQGYDSLFVTAGIHRGELHRKSKSAALDEAALMELVQTTEFAPTAAIAELVW